MSKPLVECIPNFSEARRPEVVEAIIASIKGVPEIYLLDHSSDLDHNRTVITFAGPPVSVEQAAFLGIQKAAELIDLNHHSGTHPRIGATDVVPFVPLSGMEMEECVQMARRLGERVGNELNIPVYLYEEAATRADRVNLENNRRGQFEGLKVEIENNPDRKPDFGPSRLGTAGATVIGARNPLIAFNVYLSTQDTSVAKAIAKTIRQSSGGYKFIKALGMLVDGRAQVSINFTNFHQTSLFRVVETIRREAQRYGVLIHHSELIGLIPGEALFDSAAWYLQMDAFHPDQVLENRLFAARGEPQESSDFLEALSDGTPVPGGGSAAAYAGAMGAALVAMVARLTIGKKKYMDVEPQMVEILKFAEQLRNDLKCAVEEDAAAFNAILQAFKLPKDTADEQSVRLQEIDAAMLKAAQVPLLTAEKAVKVIALAEQCVARGNLNTISDAATAASLGRAALSSAGYNVFINVNGLSNKETGMPLLSQLASLEEKAVILERDLQKSFQDRGGLPPR